MTKQKPFGDTDLGIGISIAVVILAILLPGVLLEIFQ